MVYYSIWPNLFFNPLTPWASCEKGISWTFWWFLGWILAKLALIWSKMHLHHDSLAFFLATSIAFCDILTRACAEIKILRLSFGRRKWPTSLGFSIFGIFLAFPFSPFLSCLLQWLAFYWACLWLKKLLRKRHRDGQLLPWRSQM